MIKQIWFDFGNVFIPVHPEKTRELLTSCGAQLSDEQFQRLNERYERGELSEREFLATLVHSCSLLQATRRISSAWNALLGSLNDNVFFLKSLKKSYDICLVSNTNETHIESIRKSSGPFLWNQFINAFDALFLSFEMGSRKPEAAYYQTVLENMGAEPDEVLFIDDNPENLRAAEVMGIHTWQFNVQENNLEEELPSVLAKFNQGTASTLGV